MSVEEDRLYNSVRANCLDFNVWTTLIEEAETVAEDNVLKIRNFQQVRQAHAQLVVSGFFDRPLSAGRLRQFYVTVTQIHHALSIFNRISYQDVFAYNIMNTVTKPFRQFYDTVVWGAMISGFAIHGEAEKCFELFNEMVVNGMYLNEVIFVAILSACSHAGHVEMGYEYFDQIVHDYRTLWMHGGPSWPCRVAGRCGRAHHVNARKA